MLIGIWVLRKGFTGRSHTWWMVAFWIQFWHHIEHLLLITQATYTTTSDGQAGAVQHHPAL